MSESAPEVEHHVGVLNLVGSGNAPEQAQTEQEN